MCHMYNASETIFPAFIFKAFPVAGFRNNQGEIKNLPNSKNIGREMGGLHFLQIRHEK